MAIHWGGRAAGLTAAADAGVAITTESHIPEWAIFTTFALAIGIWAGSEAKHDGANLRMAFLGGGLIGVVGVISKLILFGSRPDMITLAIGVALLQVILVLVGWSLATAAAAYATKKEK